MATYYGKEKDPMYRLWTKMIERCAYKTSYIYKWYGERGITVCKEWQESFEQFLADMGPRPEGVGPTGRALYSLDRIDNNKGYCKENCRWATTKEQASNTRRNVRITIDGITATITEHANRIGIPPKNLRSRLLLPGWTIEAAITTPITKRKRPPDRPIVLTEKLLRVPRAALRSSRGIPTFVKVYLCVRTFTEEGGTTAREVADVLNKSRAAVGKTISRLILEGALNSVGKHPRVLTANNVALLEPEHCTIEN